MQEMYCLVFVFRYLDLLWHFISLYNSCMKIFFIMSTGYLVYLIRFKPPINQTYDRTIDSFQYEIYLVGPALGLGFIFADEWSIPEILWCSSIWLESVALIPQILLLQKMREVENLTSHFVAAMGAYRAFYILNWVYRYFTEHKFHDTIPVIGGIIQTALYCDFFYYYSMSKWYGGKLVLPIGGESGNHNLKI